MSGLLSSYARFRHCQREFSSSLVCENSGASVLVSDFFGFSQGLCDVRNSLRAFVEVAVDVEVVLVTSLAFRLSPCLCDVRNSPSSFVEVSVDVAVGLVTSAFLGHSSCSL